MSWKTDQNHVFPQYQGHHSATWTDILCQTKEVTAAVFQLYPQHSHKQWTRQIEWIPTKKTWKCKTILVFEQTLIKTFLISLPLNPHLLYFIINIILRCKLGSLYSIKWDLQLNCLKQILWCFSSFQFYPEGEETVCMGLTAQTKGSEIWLIVKRRMYRKYRIITCDVAYQTIAMYRKNYQGALEN